MWKKVNMCLVDDVGFVFYFALGGTCYGVVEKRKWEKFERASVIYTSSNRSTIYAILLMY